MKICGWVVAMAFAAPGSDGADGRNYDMAEGCAAGRDQGKGRLRRSSTGNLATQRQRPRGTPRDQGRRDRDPVRDCNTGDGGGEVIDPTPTGLNEIQGSSINGGVKHDVGPGDVIEIPAGVPHQFLLAAGTQITYLVVKIIKK